jgi:hypothetical protein
MPFMFELGSHKSMSGKCPVKPRLRLLASIMIFFLLNTQLPLDKSHSRKKSETWKLNQKNSFNELLPKTVMALQNLVTII